MNDYIIERCDMANEKYEIIGNAERSWAKILKKLNEIP